MVSRDIKGAFDRLDHRRVKYHLHNIGTPPVLCKALSSFLDGRTARIRVGEVIGPPFPLLAGSPQGAGPSPKLFTLVTRGAPIGRHMGYYYSHYADDCLQIVVTQGTSVNFHRKALERAINEENEFESREGLITEPSKSFLVSIGHNKPLEVEIGDDVYRSAEKPVSFLGHDITKSSMINAQITKQIKKAKAVLCTLLRFKSLKTKFKMQLIKTLVMPYLYYPQSHCI